MEPNNRIVVLGKLVEGAVAAEFAARHEEILNGKDVTGLLLLLPSGLHTMIERVFQKSAVCSCTCTPAA